MHKHSIIIFIACIILNSIQAMDTTDNTLPPSPLALLPAEMIATVASQFNTVVGSTSFINYADLPVITEYIKAWSMVNKHHYQILNSESVTKILINSIAQRFNILPTHAAANLNTPGAREWLQQTDHYALFKIIYQPGIRSPNPYGDTTTDGLIYSQHEESSPYCHLYTPWGEMDFFDNTNLKMIINRQELYLNKTTEPYKDHTYYRIIEIHKHPIATSCLSPGCTSDQYFYFDKSWDTFKKFIQGNYVAKPNVPSNSKTVPIGNFYYKTVDYDMLVDHQQFLDTLDLQVKTIDDIPQWCLALVTRLFAQPIFPSKYSDRDNTKLLSLKNTTDGQLCTLLNETARDLLNMQKTLHIRDFGIGNLQYYDQNGNCISPGIFVHMYKPEEVKKLDLNLFHEECQQIIQEFKAGWQATTLEENPTIARKKSEEQWCLYTKKNTAHSAHSMVYYIAFKCKIPRSAFQCSNEWIVTNGNNREKAVSMPTTYLWVHKKYLDAFRKAFLILEITKK
ncbi:MAG: hypothetical protein WCE21_02275 [Candidatus Babeliales bacterium]